MTIKKLVIREFVVDEAALNNQMKIGESYSYFVDPETGKYYQPVEGFEVTGDNLNELFVEVE